MGIRRDILGGIGWSSAELLWKLPETQRHGKNNAPIEKRVL